jgi:ABC-type sugar transport system ATPase subunit
MSNEPLLSIENISKSFPGVKALSDVSFAVQSGEVHALVGENGAGKSTLMKILSGVYQPDSGRLAWQGSPLVLHSPADAQQRGITTIFQEFNLMPDLTVAENVLINREPRNRFGLIDWRAMNTRTRELLRLLEMDIDPDRLVRSLTVAQQQVVEIVKALAVDSRLLIMDEPTAALNPTEVSHLFRTVERLKARGTSVIFISHRLDEVLHISQRVTVMKDGKVVATQPTEGLTKKEIVRQMVGRGIEDIFPAKTNPSDECLLHVEMLCTPTVQNVSFRLHAGEILGFVGLEGHGQRELARALFGLERITSGEVRLGDMRFRAKNPPTAIHQGIAFISDDRKVDGLALKLGLRENVALPNLKSLNRAGFVTHQRERQSVGEMVQALGVRSSGLEQEVRQLSGGNQQKTVLAKWLLNNPRILIFVEPTRGIDIGAKVEIYQLIHELARKGTGIIVVSSELIEVLGLCHRIMVMRNGGLVSTFPHTDASEEAIMLAATGSH